MADTGIQYNIILFTKIDCSKCVEIFDSRFTIIIGKVVLYSYCIKSCEHKNLI